MSSQAILIICSYEYETTYVDSTTMTLLYLYVMYTVVQYIRTSVATGNDNKFHNSSISLNSSLLSNGEWQSCDM